jgi:hypothetical protein
VNPFVRRAKLNALLLQSSAAFTCPSPCVMVGIALSWRPTCAPGGTGKDIRQHRQYGGDEPPWERLQRPCFETGCRACHPGRQGQCGPDVNRRAIQQTETEGMTDVTVNVASSEWCVHFVVTTTQVPIGPWLLFESSEEIKMKVFCWGSTTYEEMQQYLIDLRRWGHAGVHMLLSDRQLRILAQRARGWPWNGYELIQMRKAGRYPPQRLSSHTTLVQLRQESASAALDPKSP